MLAREQRRYMFFPDAIVFVLWALALCLKYGRIGPVPSN
jgi:hypothetical protein